MYFRKTQITSYQQYGELYVIEGTGTINSEGDYTFMIRYAKDTEKSRIIISETSDGEIIYDNQFGEAPGAEPENQVSGYDDFPPASSSMNTDVSDINEMDQTSLAVYPNPTKDVVTIYVPQLEGKSSIEMEIIDMSGKRMKTDMLSAGTTSTVSLEALDAGMYLIKLYVPGETKTFQVVKE
jgi:hypothetical protein